MWIFDCALVVICALMFWGLFCRRNIRLIIPMRTYFIMFTVPALVFFVLNTFNLQIFCIPRLFCTLTQYKYAFVLIGLCVYLILFTRFKKIFINKKQCTNGCVLGHIAAAAPTVCVVSMTLLLIYVLLSDGVNKGFSYCNSSSDTFAVCAAIIAACATLYTVQRTLKQELMKNRQSWINEVRRESANMIAIVDKIKFFMNINASKDKLIELFPALIDSCAKLRMYINPRDMIAPFIISQLDIIMNNVAGSNNSAKDERPVDFNQINLRKSFMPWVLVLLKVEWERVKAILESREELSEGYYSKEVYYEQWDKNAFKEYGIDFNTSDNLIEQLFPGFTFSENKKEELNNKINELKQNLQC